MRQFQLTRNALGDLDEIADYISRDNSAAAGRLLKEFEAICSRLAEYPKLGAARPELHADARSFTAGNYVLFYRELDDGIELLRVLHAARDIASEFFE